MLVCQVCGKKCHAINKQHLAKHGMGVQEYKLAYHVEYLKDDETRNKMSNKMLGNKNSLGVKLVGERYRAYRALRASPSFRKKISDGKKLNFANPIFREAHKERQKLIMANPEIGRKISIARKAYFADSDNLIAHRKRLAEAMAKPLARLHNSQSHKGKTLPPEQKEKIRNSLLAIRKHLSVKQKQNWLNEEYRNTQPIKAMAGRQVKPNKPEIEMMGVLGDKWQYVGDGYMWVAGKCPDYWDGGNNVIELYGDYWHRGEIEQDRISHFNKHGYNCLVVWEHELKDKDKLRSELAVIL